ncbi:MAG: TIM barrel protein [Methanomassiliicoccales archaeon]|nr:TIM barrel protein [Methanomassiliicoccales archaeon]
MRFGIMVTIKDANEFRHQHWDFTELLIRDCDEKEAIEHFLSTEEMCKVVHAPELIHFSNKKMLIDLANEDDKFREFCVMRITEICEIADSYGLPTVIHPGGVLPYAIANRQRIVEGLRKSLESIGGKKWIENMPRFYHLGDHLLHCNILLSPKEYDAIRNYVNGFVLDTSHAYLSTTDDGNEMINQYLRELDESITHIHLSDAIQPADEGLQIGEGKIRFDFLKEIADLPVLLEIRGGHLNKGIGFIEARKKIEAILHKNSNLYTH